MPRYPGSQDPSDPSFAERRRLILRAIDGLSRIDRKHLTTLLDSDYVDAVEVGAIEDGDGGERVIVYVSSEKGPELSFVEDEDTFSVDPPPWLWLQSYLNGSNFREMKKAVNHFKQMVDKIT